MTALAPFPVGFQFQDAIAYEAGVSRRDPSPVIRVDGIYYVYYRQGEGPGVPWGLCQETRAADRPFLRRFDCIFDPPIQESR